MANRNFLTPADAGRLLGVAPATVRQMAREGTLPVAATTEGGNRLFERRAVDALVRKRAANKRTAKRDAREG
jgi:excisionase family DNA binding protein